MMVLAVHVGGYGPAHGNELGAGRYGQEPSPGNDDIQYLVERVRARWPDVVIHLRGDSAFARPAISRGKC